MLESKPIGVPTKVVLLNGPSHSGKSMAVTFLRKEFPDASVIDPKHPLTRLVSIVFMLTHDECMLFSLPAEKNVPRTKLLGLSWREALIWASEDVLKKKFGDDAIGQFGVADIFTKNKVCRLFFVDSVGFTNEALCYYKSFGNRNVLTVKLVREGKTFEGDSRGYVDEVVIKEQTQQSIVTINNRYELDLFREQIKMVVQKWLLM